MKCREATRAMSERQERALTLGEQAGLKLHLAMCRACRNFGQQVDFLRESMRAYPGRPDDERDPSQ